MIDRTYIPRHTSLDMHGKIVNEITSGHTYNDIQSRTCITRHTQHDIHSMIVENYHQDMHIWVYISRHTWHDILF